MTIAHIASQGASNTASNATSVTCAFPGNVTAGSLIQIMVGSEKFSVDDSVAGDCTKSAGTATIDTPTLDAQVQIGNNYWAVLFSALVTGSGSLTMQVANFPASTNLAMYVDEFSGSWDGTRAEDTDARGDNNGVIAPTSNAMTSAGAALFIGVARDSAGTFTVSGDYTAVAAEVQQTHAIYRIVTGGTTDSVEWTAPIGGSWALASAVYKEAAGGGIALDDTGWSPTEPQSNPLTISVW